LQRSDYRASGWWENTGQVWKSASKDSVGNQWGGPPILAEVVPFTLALPVGTNRVSAWALDERGQRKATLPITGTGTNTVVTVNAGAASIWYELEVARYLAGFDLWRSTNFAAAELTNPAVSGESAAPAGDGVPNLLKYYLGLAAKTVALPEQLPRGDLLAVSNLLFLALSYEREKTATDVNCVAEVSSNLTAWSSGEEYTAIAGMSDLGSRERVTVRERTPVNAATARFMRLRFFRPFP
jgi:hypothetical protein